MKCLILVPLALVVGCGPGALDAGARLTTAAEARDTCKLLLDTVRAESDFADADTVVVEEAIDLVLDTLFQEIRAFRDAGFIELETMLIKDDDCLVTSTDPTACSLCSRAVIAAVYDE